MVFCVFERRGLGFVLVCRSEEGVLDDGGLEVEVVIVGVKK